MPHPARGDHLPQTFHLAAEWPARTVPLDEADTARPATDSDDDVPERYRSVQTTGDKLPVEDSSRDILDPAFCRTDSE